MEEKERYEIHIYDDICVDLYDNGVLDKSINDTYKLEKLLNQQDKRIKELEEELDDAKRDYIPKLEFGLQRANKMGRDAEKENQQLKQQLIESEADKKAVICDYESRITKEQELMSWLEHNNEQLKQQLVASEKKFVVSNNLRKNSDEVLLNYKTEKYGLDKTIQELRKMKLSLPEKEWYYKGFENCERQMSSYIADLTLKVKELKQQLEEKEKYTYTGKEVGKIEQNYENQLAITEKALELACEHIKEDLKCDDTQDEIYNYFKNKAKEMLENE